MQITAQAKPSPFWGMIFLSNVFFLFFWRGFWGTRKGFAEFLPGGLLASIYSSRHEKMSKVKARPLIMLWFQGREFLCLKEQRCFFQRPILLLLRDWWGERISLFHLRLMSMSGDNDIVFPRSKRGSKMCCNMGHEEMKIFIEERHGSFFYLPKGAEDFLKSMFFSIAVAKDSFHRAA